MDESTVSQIQDLVITLGWKILAAIIILVVGRWVAKLVKKLVTKLLNKRNVEGTIVSFVSSMVYIALMAFIVIAAIAKLGYETTSFVAILGAAGLAIGFALKGTLANFASGFLLLLFHPFKKGDYIEGGGVSGVVDEIQIFTTILKTPDNKKVIVPNAKLTSDNIINYSATGTRRVELTIGVSYGDDLDKVRSVLQTIIDEDSRVLKDPASQIAVKELADSSVNFVFRVWVNTADYWNVFLETTEKVKKRFDAEGISIPFPQRDIHVYETK